MWHNIRGMGEKLYDLAFLSQNKKLKNMNDQFVKTESNLCTIFGP